LRGKHKPEFTPHVDTGDIVIGISTSGTSPNVLKGLRVARSRGAKILGLTGKYGIEIEAISGQPGGHQHLREIVAEELLKYLVEHDRIDEITNEVWEKAPLKAIKQILNYIDGNFTSDKEIKEEPEEIPERYLSYDEYLELLKPLEEKIEEEAKEIDEEIAELEEQLEWLREEREDRTSETRRKISDLIRQYLRSRDVLAHSLYKHYQEREDEWDRTDYDLGYPKGCILESVKEQQNLNEFLRKIEDKEIVGDISKALEQSYVSGELTPIIEAIMNGDNNEQ